jgi:polyisoprenyl-teichoic acid--peptidoglycan teichoic acid transferase
VVDDQGPRRVWLRATARFLLAGLLLAALSGVATWTFAQNTLSTLASEVFPAKNRITGAKGLVVPGYEGSPQTFLLIGSDKRVGAKNAEERQSPPRSDTLLLVRLDPQQGQTSVLSIPRDLLVRIETESGQTYYPEKINAAYTIGSEHGGKDGGAKLAAATIEKLLKIKLNGIVDVTFKGFIDVVDALGCVYINVDHRYSHTSSLEAGEDYSSIHLASGYQRLCYESALSYVRYRHLDSDFVRVARQQDFIRQLREQVSAGDLLSQIERVSKAVGRAVITTFSSSGEELLRLTKLIVFSQRKPLRQVKFRFSSENTVIEGGDYVTASPEEISQTVHEFLSPGRTRASLEGAAPRRASHAATRAGSGRSGSRWRGGGPPPPSAVGLYPVSESIRNEAVKMATQLPFPVVLPGLQTGPAEPQEAHSYRLRDREGHPHHGFVEVFQQSPIGGYYDVEGLNWTDPPLVANVTQTQDIGRRHYMLVDDGAHIHVIAWREHGVLYWVNNTLLEELSNSQMIYLAQSARPLR